jgi:phage terminase small subunit
MPERSMSDLGQALNSPKRPVPDQARKRMASAQINRRQQKFVEEYANTLNSAEAARRAGYSPKTAKEMGHENLTKPHVKAAVEAEIARLTVKITPDRVQRRLDEISHEAQQSGQFGPAVRAEELLGKSIGMWIDQSIQLSGTLQGSHVAALLEVAKRRQLEPIDLADDGDGNWKQSERDERD